VSTPAAPPFGQSRARGRAALLVALGTLVANLLAYAFNISLSRALGPDSYGELAALLAVVIVGSVPGIALQAGAARGIATATGDIGRIAEGLIARSVRIAVLVALITLIAAPLLHAFLGTGSYVALCWLALSLVPTIIVFGCQGILQGQERYAALASVLVLAQLGRLAGGIMSLAVHPGVTGALAGAALGATPAAAVALFLAAPGLLTRPRPGAVRIDGLGRDTLAMLGILALSNLDLVLARHYLPESDAGIYAAGNLVTKAAFWGPGFVATVAYAQLTRAPERADALRTAVRLLGAIAVVGITTSALAAPLVPYLLGPEYSAVSGSAWLFATAGVLLAGVLLFLYAGVAVHDRRLAVAVWAVAAAECVAVAWLWHESRTEILLVAVAGALLLLATGLGLELRGRGGTDNSAVTQPSGQARGQGRSPGPGLGRQRMPS